MYLKNKFSLYIPNKTTKLFCPINIFCTFVKKNSSILIVTIKEVSSRKELRQFVRFATELYKDSPVLTLNNYKL